MVQQLILQAVAAGQAATKAATAAGQNAQSQAGGKNRNMGVLGSSCSSTT